MQSFLVVVSLVSLTAGQKLIASEPCNLDVDTQLVDEAALKQCDGILVNWFLTHIDLNRTDLVAVAAKKTATGTASQILVKNSKIDKCSVGIVENSNRGPPVSRGLCNLPLPCAVSSQYNKC